MRCEADDVNESGYNPTDEAVDGGDTTSDAGDDLDRDGSREDDVVAMIEVQRECPMRLSGGDGANDSNETKGSPADDDFLACLQLC